MAPRGGGAGPPHEYRRRRRLRGCAVCWRSRGTAGRAPSPPATACGPRNPLRREQFGWARPTRALGRTQPPPGGRNGRLGPPTSRHARALGGTQQRRSRPGRGTP
eukprot:857622-Pyramimonas_sp.AAC.1